MKNKCELIQDLLPLYADDACSGESRRIVEEHLQECPDCDQLLHRLKDREIEENLAQEKDDVIAYGTKRFRKRSAAVGSTVSGLFMIPILVCLIINITTGAGLGWFFILAGAMAVAASLILVPIVMPEDKLFWTFCAFCVSLILLFAIICTVNGGNWFWVASSSVLFGLSVVFLPFVIKARPLKKWIGKSNKVLLVIAVDMLLFLNMMTAINAASHPKMNGWMVVIGFLAGAALACVEIRKRNEK